MTQHKRSRDADGFTLWPIDGGDDRLPTLTFRRRSKERQMKGARERKRGGVREQLAQVKGQFKASKLNQWDQQECNTLDYDGDEGRALTEQNNG